MAVDQYEKKRFDRIRQNYESAVENLKNSQKTSKANVRALQQEQEEVNRLKVQCEKTAFDTLVSIITFNQILFFLLSFLLIDYVLSECEYK